jgi:hypothetical protein
MDPAGCPVVSFDCNGCVGITMADEAGRSFAACRDLIVDEAILLGIGRVCRGRDMVEGNNKLSHSKVHQVSKTDLKSL